MTLQKAEMRLLADAASRPHAGLVFKLYALLAIGSIIVMLWSLVEAAGTDESRMRHLPKLSWILLILFVPLLGAVAWLVAGRPVGAAPRPKPAPPPSKYDRPHRSAAADPVKDEAYLKKVRERAEEQRRRYEQQRKKKPEDSHEPEAPTEPEAEQ